MSDSALFTDLYELSMARVYDAEAMEDEAVFELFFRELPEGRDYVLACGQTDCLRYLHRLKFEPRELEWLASLERFPPAFLERLQRLRFTGTVRAIPEGSVVFPLEPVLQVRAPLLEAQLVETYLLNAIHAQSVLASKAARVVQAAYPKPVMDFGARKAQGVDGARNLAKATYLAGAAGTSNMEAGFQLDIPVLGTMAHSYVQVYDRELQAFADFSRHWPETTLLVDTWDTLTGVDRVIQLLDEHREDDPRPVSAIRLDSGNLGELARAAREKLDRAGYREIKIVVSSGLDEYKIRDLMAAGAPIDGFGVGTEWAAVADAPSIDFAYKLTEYAGEGRLKASSGKATWPGPKQVWRQWQDGRMVRDFVTAEEESGFANAQPLLQTVMRNGTPTSDAFPSLHRSREQARSQLNALPDAIRELDRAPHPYPVHVSDKLEADRQAVISRHHRVNEDE